MDSKKDKFQQAAKEGLNKGFSGFLWMLKILIPISFCTLLIDYSGILNHMDFLLKPVMGVLSLPPAAALPLVIGLLTGIYGAVAAMMVLPLTHEQMTLIAIFLLISHNLIQEGIIQKQAGFDPVKATLFRLVASVITVIICARVLNPDITAAVVGETATAAREAFTPLLLSWFSSTAYLVAKIFVLIISIMVLLQVMKSFEIIPHILRRIHPVLTVMGLDRAVGMLWVTAGLFGLTYGSAVIVEETRENTYAREELNKLHLSIGINHAMIEDPALFLPLGLTAFWLWIPRLAAAVVATHLLKLWYRFRSKTTATVNGEDHSKNGAEAQL